MEGASWRAGQHRQVVSKQLLITWGGLVVLIHSPRLNLLGYENRVPIIDGAWYHSGYSTSVHRSDMWSVLHEKTGSIDRW